MPKAKILIVEDDAIIARHVLSILKKNGYEVCGHVSSGSLAIEQARQCAPDLVLMDISLEGELDGIQAAQQIHEFLDIPVIYLTAYDDPATLQRAQVTDPFGYILKPFEERTLVTNTEMALNQHRLQRALRESYAELQQRANYLLILNQITQAALHSVDLEQSLQQITALLNQLYRSDGIYITLWDESRKLTIPAAAYGYTADTYTSIPHDPGERTLTYAVLEAQKPLVAADVTHSPYIDPELGATFPLRSLLGIPLIANDQKLGAILVGFREMHAFTADEIGRGEEIAAQVSLAITKLRLYAQVQKLAITDELTGLYNRRGIFELGREQVTLAKKTGAPLSLVWLDIDHFKEINDGFGHPAGDEVICVVADRCRNNVKGRDLVGRYGGEGGDELIIILVDTNLATAYEVAERLRLRILNHAITTGKGSLNITVSLGVTTLGPQDADLTSILNRADRAMYAAKAAGRNCVFSLDTEERS